MQRLCRVVQEEIAVTTRLLEEISFRSAPSKHYNDLRVFLEGLCKQASEEVQTIMDKADAASGLEEQDKEALRQWVQLRSYLAREILRYCEWFDYTDLLRSPTGTMQLLHRLLARVTSHKSFIVRGSHQFNYTYRNIGTKLNTLAARVDNSLTRLDDSFAIVSFPLASGEDILSNCNLVHEIGHFVVDSEELVEKLAARLKPEQVTQIENIVGKHSQKASEGGQIDLEYTRRVKGHYAILSSWIHEMMADLIGVHLLGPAHFLAFVKLLEPLGAHGEDDDEHPCDSTRVGILVKTLEELGWDTVLQRECSEAWKRANEIKDTIRIPHPTYDASAECLPLIEKEILATVQDLIGTDGYEPKTFLSCKDSIQELLKHAIPPAELLPVEEKSEFITLDAESIVNGGWFFAESDYPGWDTQFKHLTYEEKAELLNRLVKKAVEVVFVNEAGTQQ